MLTIENTSKDPIRDCSIVRRQHSLEQAVE
jgi:hypothetical protein